MNNKDSMKLQFLLCVWEKNKSFIVNYFVILLFYEMFAKSTSFISSLFYWSMYHCSRYTLFYVVNYVDLKLNHGE